MACVLRWWKKSPDHIENDADGGVRQRAEYCHPYRCNNNFLPDEHHLHGAESLLNELYKWAQALKTMRQ